MGFLRALYGPALIGSRNLDILPAECMDLACLRRGGILALEWRMVHIIKGQGERGLSNRGRFGKYGEIKRLERLALSARGKAQHSALLSAEPARKRRSPTPGINFKLRAGSPGDRVFVRSLSQKVFSVYGPYDEILDQWFVEEACMSFVALKKGARIGFILIGNPSVYASDMDVEILALAVEPVLHGFGVGSALLSRAEKVLKTMGIRSLLLHTAVDNLQAVGFFKSQGFITFESRAAFYPRGQDALSMKKNLN